MLLLVNVLWLVYMTLLIVSNGEPRTLGDVYLPVQGLVLSLDIVAGALLALGFWQFGLRHDTIRDQALNMAIGWGVWTLVTFVWRLSLLWIPAEEVNPISRRMTDGSFNLFIPHFDFLRVNLLGFFVSSVLMFILMVMLVNLIKNYRVYESFKTVNLSLFRAYGLFQVVGVLMMALGWQAFSPGATVNLLGDVLLVVFVMAWAMMFVVLPIVAIWIFRIALTIHRSALETLKFILRRKAERDLGSGTEAGRGGPSPEVTR